MAIATLALIGLVVASYLWLWKVGAIGQIACGAGECDRVQNSAYAFVLGQPVALYGVIGYLTLLIVSLIGVQPRWAARREPMLLLVGLSGAGVGFTLYLTYLEAFVIQAWCRWCLVSAGIIGAIFVTALLGVKRERRQGET